MVQVIQPQLTYYHGARTFQWLSDLIHLPIDQVNFIIAQLCALFLSLFFRKFIYESGASAKKRHIFNLIAGVSLGYFCFGYQIYHIFVQSMLSYIIVTNVTPEISHRLVMFVALFYLSSMHMQRQFYSYGSYTLDVTGPLMLLTQKVTSFAFDLHDGVTIMPDKLSQDQKKLAIRKLPSPLEYFSYTFNFQTLMSGPLLSYVQYIEFMNDFVNAKPTDHETDRSALNDKNKQLRRPSPKYAIIKKLLVTVIFLLIIVFVQPLFPSDYLTSDDFHSHSYFWIMGYLMVFTNVARFKYYLAWRLSEAVCNASGLGFNGYDKNGDPLWNGVSNVDIIGFEFGENMRAVLASWNMTTQVWLKRYAYERVSRHKTLTTYLLSALWHGFYPGYYLMFVGAAIFTESARIVRRHIRPIFQRNKLSAQLYDVLTIITTRVVISYLSFCFIILHLTSAIYIYVRLYFSLHLIAIAAYFILPVLLPQFGKQNDAKQVGSTQNNNVAHQLDKNI